jgi:hypothetical protein
MEMEIEIGVRNLMVEGRIESCQSILLQYPRPLGGKKKLSDVN